MTYCLKLLRLFHLISKEQYNEKRQIEIVKSSPLFDKKYYLAQNPDVKTKHISAARHYVKHGWKEGRPPSKNFDDVEYIKTQEQFPSDIFQNSKEKTYNNYISANDYALVQNSKFFDNDWYLSQNPDVAQAKIDPVIHYIKYGLSTIPRNPGRFFDNALYNNLCLAFEHKKRCPLIHFEKRRKNIDIDVLLISPLPVIDGVYIWRTLFLKEYLTRFAIKAQTECLVQPTEDFFNRFYSAKIIIFSRPILKEEHLRLIRLAQNLNKKIFLDIDDLLLPQYANYSGACMSNIITYQTIRQNNILHTSSFFYADNIITSTMRLQQKMHEVFNQRHLIYHNKIAAEYILPTPKTQTKSSTLNLLYASGSSTHDFDFSKIYLPLCNFLIAHPDVNLTILGSSQAGKNFCFLKNRLTVISKVSFPEMLNIFKEHDLLLIPLDENIFNHAKSNIKYIEAGSQATPVLAASCHEFKKVIKNNENGFLYDETNITQQLEYIYKNKHLLTKIGETARIDVLTNHSTLSAPQENIIDALKEALC